MFRITDSKGFQVTFDNGVMLSVQFGPGNYTDAEIREKAFDAPRRAHHWEAKTAEVAVILPNGDFCDLPLEHSDGQVAGWQTVEDFVKWVDFARNIKTEVRT